MQILETQHLTLLPFSLEFQKVALTEKARLAGILGIHIPDSWPGPDMEEVLPFFIEVMEKDPTGRVWDGIIVHKADQTAIGCMGFKGGPDKRGMMEIGYNIIPEYRGRGYATEMAQHLIDWAFRTQKVKVVTAECFYDNIGSMRVLEKVGMYNFGSEGNMLKWELRR